MNNYKLLIAKEIETYVGTVLIVGTISHPYKGVYSSALPYLKNDAVSYNGQYYYADENVDAGFDPSNPIWIYAGSGSYLDDIYNYTYEWSVADMGDDKPAMNYQVNNIAELKDRQVDYSQSLKLPPTPNNCKIFGYSNEFDVVSVIPYRKLNCRLFAGDSLIAGAGSYLIFDKTSKYFEVRILSGNVDLFELLKNKQVSELDLGYYTLGSKNMFEAYSTVNYCIPAVNTILNINSKHITTAKTAYPFAWLKSAIEKICTSNGYTLQTNLLASDWNRKAINICSNKPNSDSLTSFNAHASGSITNATSGQYIAFNVSPNGNGKLVSFVNGATKGLRWTAPCDCSIKILFAVSTPSPLTSSDLKIMNGSETIHSLTNTLNGSINETINVNEGDVLEITAYKRPDSTNTKTTTYTFDLSEMVAEQVPVGGKLYIAPNIGFDTQFDLFKAFVQYYGMTLMVDNVTKTIYCYTIQKIYDSKSIANDWSKKVVTGKYENETSFNLSGYAKSNKIKLEDNTSDNSGITIINNAAFTIDNETLEGEKELFTIKFESGKNYKTVVQYDNAKISSTMITNIPIEEYDDASLSYSFKGAKPHIVDIVDSPFYGVTLLIAVQGELQNHINTHYDKLINNMLVNAKVVEDEFLLTEQDIEDYKAVKDEVPGAFIPVYVEKYGAYFYINKIKNFVSGKLTKCELVRL